MSEVFTGEAYDLASDGQAVVRHPAGYVVFVAGLWPGETAQIRILQYKKKHAIGEIAGMESASTNRRKPPCRFHGAGSQDCGGCPWMFIDYEAQLQAKYDRVKRSIEKLPHSREALRPIVRSENEFSYRNRAQFKTNGKRLGFVSARNKQLVTVDDCLILSEKNRETLSELIAALPEKRWQPGKRKVFTTLDIDESRDAAQVSINRRLPFLQANTAQNNRMREWLAQKARTIETQTIIELFCGSGNFTEVIVENSKATILAIEVADEALGVLASKKLANVEIICADLFDQASLSRALAAHQHAEVLILDPPRDGFKLTQATLALLSKLKHVIYISCDLATWTRDANDFIAHDFVLRELQPLDQFPQTPHIELLSHFERKP